MGIVAGRVRLGCVTLVILISAACSGASTQQEHDAGEHAGAGASAAGMSGSAAGSVHLRGPWSPTGLDYDVQPGVAIEAPASTWTYVGFPEALCANGTSTGIAINRVDDSDGLLLFMQGGGACWDAETCLVAKASIHLEDTVDQSVVLSDVSDAGGLFDRSNAANYFRNFDFVYVPYCTGDLHTGTRAAVYTSQAGVPTTVQHHGGLNVEAYLSRLVPTFHAAKRVVISGISAGGFGVTFNWWRYQAAFPNARVDVLDDAGLMVDPNDARFETMSAVWGLQAPAGCADCSKRISAWLPFYGDHLAAPRRYALTGYLGDAVIGSYFGLDADALSQKLLALRKNAAPNQKTFFLNGKKHSALGEGLTTPASDGSTLYPWLLQLVTDDPAWNHAGP